MGHKDQQVGKMLVCLKRVTNCCIVVPSLHDRSHNSQVSVPLFTPIPMLVPICVHFLLFHLPGLKYTSEYP